MQARVLVITVVLFIASCQRDTALPESSAPEPVIAVRTPSPQGAAAYIISPEEGATVHGEAVKVVFGLRRMGVAPAGVEAEDTGHHHLLVDVATMPDMDLPIPADSNHIHFGKGQTETILTLSPGSHTLQLLLGDYRHIPHDPPVASAVVSITVE